MIAVLIVTLIAAAGASVIFYLQLHAARKLIVLLEQQIDRMTSEIKGLIDEFKEQRTSLEGALRTVRAQRDRQANTLAEIARRFPQLIAPVFDAQLREAHAATGGAGAQSAVPEHTDTDATTDRIRK